MRITRDARGRLPRTIITTESFGGHRLVIDPSLRPDEVRATDEPEPDDDLDLIAPWGDDPR